MIANLSLANFKKFGAPGLSLECAPLTLILGPNSSGKTTILDAIALMAQTAAAFGRVHGFAWDGELIDFGPSGLQALHLLDKSRELTLHLEVNLGTEPWKSVEQDLSERYSTTKIWISGDTHSRNW
jgi:recombinational DNA repair ATPase RecF